MNLEQLQSFIEVARLGHFTQAAAHLHLAQPSLSRQISTLEYELGQELFHRARGNITLTAAGESLLPLAKRMLADADRVRHEMQELAGLRRGQVRIGATPTLCVSLVADVLARFNAKYPGIDLHLTESGSRGLLEELAGGTLDIALVTSSEQQTSAHDTFTRIPLLIEELVVVASSQSKILGGKKSLSKSQISLRELAELPQLTFHENYDLRQATTQAFVTAGLQPHIVLEGAQMDAVLRCVERGLGVAVVPAMVLVDRPGLQSVRLCEPTLSRTVSLARRNDVALTKAAAAMQEFILDTAKTLALASSEVVLVNN